MDRFRTESRHRVPPTKRWGRLRPGQRTAATLIGATLYLGLTLALATGARAELPAYDVPERSDPELLDAARSACEAARAEQRPLLLEFSAEWCTDCRALQLLVREPALAAALGRYQSLAINVGDFDRHPVLLRSFDVRAIAHWVVVAPGDCATPPYLWRRIASRTLEPASGTEVRSEELARWLDTQREAALPSD